MTLGTADYTNAYAYGVTSVLYARSIMLGLVSRRVDGLFTRNKTVKIWKDATSITDGSDYTEGAALKSSADTPDGAFTDMVINQKKEWATKANLEEVDEVQLDTLASLGRDLGIGVRTFIDKYIWGVIAAGMPATANYASDVVVDAAGVETGNGTAVLDAIDHLTYVAESANVLASLGENGYSNMWLAMSPALWRALKKNVRDLGSDQLTYETLRNGMVGRFDGQIDVIRSNNIGTRASVTNSNGPGNISNKTVHEMVLGVNEATFFAERRPITNVRTPENNSGGFWYGANHLRRYRALAVQTDRIFKYQFATT